MALIPLKSFSVFYSRPPSKSNPQNPTKPPKTTLKLLCNAMLESDRADPERPTSQNALQTPANYPKPLSPSLPPISKDAELSRAMTASSKSSLYSISRSEFLFEDDWLVVVNKPPGIYCESVFDSVRKVLSDSPELGTGTTSSPEFHLANRLDRDTTGVMLITKSHKVAAELVKAFTDHKVSKTYIASCTGPAPKWEKITVKSGHGRSKFGAWRVYAASDVGRKLPGGSAIREMETSFELLSVNGQTLFKEPSDIGGTGDSVIVVEERAFVDGDEKKDELLVRARPKSGRSHQIRLHCQYLGISIRGDVKYEGVTEWKGIAYDAHQLHAESLSFNHPVTGLWVEFRAPLPSWAIQATER